ncbi:UbiA family prenyltransferase [Nocardioides sp.]|uniref:UbiA family prenyltransferase n=1 Tax=Nocardioides sp. TaxID=35761 RepID=UPI0031FF2CB4|nr:UbiA prenyltransferase family protein [Nocardioides sp.]
MIGRRRRRSEDSGAPSDAPETPEATTATPNKRGTAVLETAPDAAPDTSAGPAEEPPPDEPLDGDAAGTRQHTGWRLSLRNLTPLLLLRAAHPRQAILTAFGLAVAAALANRPTREVGLVFATVLVGQAVLGWHNDIVDRARDAAHQTPGKPIADGRLDPGTAWFALACGVLLVVPLAISNGTSSGMAYLVSLLVGIFANLALRRGFLSWLPWAVAFALYPAFLSYGGWAGNADGGPPEPWLVVLAALLGIGAHFLTSLWGLVPDNADGWTYLPLKLGLRLGAGRLLAVTCLYIALVLVGMAFAGTYVGLAQ